MAAYDRRYQIFISSTLLDLQEERQAVLMALLQLDAIPAGMELFPAADEDAWTLIKGVIDDSDYYLLVVGGKYGSIDPIDDLSYTEKEFDYAVSKNKPVMAFLHGNPDAIPAGRSERSEEAQERLAQFRAKVERRKHVKYWSGPEDLAGKVALSFGQFAKTYPAIGWIRADQQASPETLAEIHELRKRLAKTENELEQVRSSPPVGTEILAQGDDTFECPIDYSATYKKKISLAKKRIKTSILVRPSWDEIFHALGPLMLDEASVEALASRIDEWAENTYWPAIVDDIEELTESEEDLVEGEFSNPSVEIPWDTFHSILVQLKALGLIAKSERRRSVADKGTYWTLTPYGETRLIQLRAIRRDVAPAHQEPM
jgi:Domain of unknown function (DUF4062)